MLNTRSIRYALEKLGLPSPPDDALLWCIGPPLLVSLGKLVGQGLAEQALALYRERFSDIGKLENRVYGGIPETLASLKAREFKLLVATAKPHVFAKLGLAKLRLKPTRGFALAVVSRQLTAKT